MIENRHLSGILQNDYLRRTMQERVLLVKHIFVMKLRVGQNTGGIKVLNVGE